ncbi:MAG: 3-carboxy-cis,cis-muconate cycloisomerase [Pararhizobium sp.]
MSVSVFDHPFLSGLFGDDAAARYFTAEAELRPMIAFEAALARAEAEEGLVSPEAADAIADLCEHFRPDMDRLREATARDGVVVPELVRQMRETIGEPHAAVLHFGATSQDLIDTSFVLRLRPALALCRTRLEALVATFERLEAEEGRKPLLARTRMQAAIAITAGDRLRTWREPLLRRLADLPLIEESVAVVQFGGAAGTLDRLGEKGRAVRQRLAAALGLQPPRTSWHSERDRFARLAGWLSTVTGSLGKFGQDVALMAQNSIDEIAVAGGGGSSAMAHKRNPVKAEALVALARLNAVHVSGAHHAMIHEQERSGAAWSLEWMILPQMVMTTASALGLALALAGSIQRVGSDSS